MLTASRTIHEQLRTLQILPGKAEGTLVSLYRACLAELDLSAVDYQTIRDLLALVDHPRDAALEGACIALFAARNEGSLCIRMNRESLARRLPAFAERDAVIDEFLAAVPAGRYAALIGEEESAFLPLIVRDGYLYFQRYRQYEQSLHEKLHALLLRPCTWTPTALDEWRRIIVEVLAAPSKTPAGAAIELNSEQQLALAVAVLREVAIVTGGPGTGKTSIVFGVLRCLLRGGTSAARIALTAPTGRAAQRMSESLQSQFAGLEAPTDDERGITALTGQTLHRLLGYSPARNSFRYHRDNPLPVDVVIVDEVSMVDVVLMARLLEAMSPAAKLILLGDACQLPSVEAGAVLADLVPHDRAPAFSAPMCAAVATLLPALPALSPTPDTGLMTDLVVRLTQSHRSGPGIMAVANLINRYTEADEETLLATLDLPDSTCRWEDAEQYAHQAWLQRLLRWAEEGVLGETYRSALAATVVPTTARCSMDAPLRAVIRGAQRAKLLTVIHEGWHGCDGINAYLAERVRATLDPGNLGRFFLGAPIMVTRNDYVLELFNGDSGVVVRDDAGGLRVAFPRGNEALLVPFDSLPEPVLAFAITVHKSQGSEYDHVLLTLPTTDSASARRLLTREILYTGLTRARHSATIHASREILLHACQAQVQRDSGLELWG
jgi:exodeoxyribonuclease V alpha subunit